ncbi:hypothetical protein AQZ49_10065 [Novosphingobium sp. FSW06-99]|nr:hypothetical protein AQZ49_10065 [Novosphingobium sp. FSW06-99]
MESPLFTPDQNPGFGNEVPGRYGAPRQSRYVAAVLSAGVCGLLALVLISMAAVQDLGRGNQSILTALTLVPPPVEKQKQPKPTKAAQAPKPAQQTAPAATMKQPPHIDVNNPNKVEWPPGFIHTDHLEMANSDIAKIHSGVAPGNAQASGGGGHSFGDGPDDRGYYRAHWYRKPPRSVYESYMRPEQRGITGWGEVVCRAIDQHHVEDCHELAESPRGSGFARVMREAAWQYLIWPPKKGTEYLIGAEVVFHTDFNVGKEEDDTPKTGESP